MHNRGWPVSNRLAARGAASEGGHGSTGGADHSRQAPGGHALEHAQDGRRFGGAASTIMRHWHAHGLKPHILRGFKVSRDPKFVEKLEDIVGLYMPKVSMQQLDAAYRARPARR